MILLSLMRCLRLVLDQWEQRSDLTLASSSAFLLPPSLMSPWNQKLTDFNDTWLHLLNVYDVAKKRGNCLNRRLTTCCWNSYGESLLQQVRRPQFPFEVTLVGSLPGFAVYTQIRSSTFRALASSSNSRLRLWLWLYSSRLSIYGHLLH